MLHIIFLVIYILGAGNFSGTEYYILNTIYLGICVIAHIRDRKHLITPLFLLYLGVIIVNIANIDLINQVETHNIKTYTYIVPKYINTATLIWCISNTLCIMGYQFIKNKSLPSISFEVRNKNFLKYLFWILLVLNLLSITGNEPNFGGGQIYKIFGLLNSIGILFFARLWGKGNSKIYRNYTLCLYIVETYIALTTSYLRFTLIEPTFYLAIGYFIGKGHIKYILSYRIIPFLVIIIIYSSVFTTLKLNRSNFISVFTGDNSQAERDYENQGKGGLLDRSANLAQLTNVVNLVEKNGFYKGSASAPIITALIPRALWPEKPLIQLGGWFALEIGAANKGENGRINNSINMTAAGELYLDFGWIGVVIGSLLFGMFLALLWNATNFYSSEYNLTGTIFGGYLLLLSIGSYADLQVVITLLSTYLIFLMIKKLVPYYENTRNRAVVERK